MNAASATVAATTQGFALGRQFSIATNFGCAVAAAVAIRALLPFT
jgi:hypothetical protein